VFPCRTGAVALAGEFFPSIGPADLCERGQRKYRFTRSYGGVLGLTGVEFFLADALINSYMRPSPFQALHEAFDGYGSSSRERVGGSRAENAARSSASSARAAFTAS